MQARAHYPRVSRDVKVRWKTVRDVSARMRLIRSQGTKVEIAFSRILRYHQIPYRAHPKSILGKPDFILAGTNLIVFCDGSFWHGRYLREFSRQSYGKNQKLWLEKLRRNVRRDRRVTDIRISNRTI